MSSPASGRTSRTRGQVVRWPRGRRGSRSAPGRRRPADHVREDLDLQLRRDRRARPPRAASRSRRRTRQPPSNAAPSSGRSERPSCGAPAMTSTSAGPDRVPGVGDREEQSQRASRGGAPVRQRARAPARRPPAAARWPAAAAPASARARAATARRSRRRPGTRPARRARRARRATTAVATSKPDAAPGTSSSATAPQQEEQPATTSVRSSRRSTPRDARLPGLLEEALGGVSLLSSRACHRSLGAMSVADGPAAPGHRPQSPRVGIDVDVVDRPGASVVLGVEDELDAEVLVAVPQRQHAARGSARASAASAVPVADRADDGLVRVPAWSCQRSLTFSTPHVPLVRRAKKRNVGRSMSTHTVGETALPPASMASDLESPAPRTDHDSLPAVDREPRQRPAAGCRTRSRRWARGCSRWSRRRPGRPWSSASTGTRPARRRARRRPRRRSAGR